MDFNNHPELIDATFVFDKRGSSLPADRRPLWRISLIVELLNRCSRGSKSSIARLHVLDWAIRSETGTQQLAEFLESGPSLRFEPVRFDPAVLRAIDFGRASGLFDLSKQSVQLTSQGEDFARALIENKELFARERQIMARIGKSFTENKVDAFLKGGAGS